MSALNDLPEDDRNPRFKAAGVAFGDGIAALAEEGGAEREGEKVLDAAAIVELVEKQESGAAEDRRRAEGLNLCTSDYINRMRRRWLACSASRETVSDQAVTIPDPAHARLRWLSPAR